MLILLFLLQVKHLIVDFFMQGPYQYKNKGTLGHPGGILHAFNHGFTTGIILYLFDFPLWPALVEAVAHYFIDWSKVNITKHYGWGPTTHEKFWWAVGVDQFLHQLCYIGMLAIIYGV